MEPTPDFPSRHHETFSRRWVAAECAGAEQRHARRTCPLSMECLTGGDATDRLLPSVRGARPAEIDGLATGGWPSAPDRLSAYLTDSGAAPPVMGYGLRYDYGVFKHFIPNTWRPEQPGHWLRSDPVEIARPDERVEIALGGSFEVYAGALSVVPGRRSMLIGIPFDRPMTGGPVGATNTLRLWAAATPDYFDFARFCGVGIGDALADSPAAETLTHVFYAGDSTTQGRGLRFLQEYFLVACSLADLLRRFRRDGNDWAALPEYAAIRLNDTHPALAVSELMRLLIDVGRLGWSDAWDLTLRTLACTSRVLLLEALEKWPVPWFEHFLPRQLEIIYEINLRFLDDP